MNQSERNIPDDPVIEADQIRDDPVDRQRAKIGLDAEPGSRNQSTGQRWNMRSVNSERRAEIYGEGQAVLGSDIGGQQHQKADRQVRQEDDPDDGRKRHAALDAGSAERIGRDDHRYADPDPGIAQAADRPLVQPRRKDRLFDQG